MLSEIVCQYHSTKTLHDLNIGRHNLDYTVNVGSTNDTIICESDVPNNTWVGIIYYKQQSKGDNMANFDN